MALSPSQACHLLLKHKVLWIKHYLGLWANIPAPVTQKHKYSLRLFTAPPEMTLTFLPIKISFKLDLVWDDLK